MATFEQHLVADLHGVGQRLSERLARLGVRTFRDLLLYLPLRYQDRTQITPLAQLRPGTEALIEGQIADAEIHHGRRRILRVLVADGTQVQLLLLFFHFSPAQAQRMKPATQIRAYGEVRFGFGALEMIHPEYELNPAPLPPPETAHLTPIYPTAEGLTQAMWRALTDQVLEQLAQQPDSDWLKAYLPSTLPALGSNAALRWLHRPPAGTDLESLRSRQHPVCRRLAGEELFAHQLALRQLRHERRQAKAPPLVGDGSLVNALLAALPFTLTAAQQQVLVEIAEDLAQPRPMMRLLQGDVGSGKTIVAALAALQAVESGYQVALMAPTELLAEQHRRHLAQWLNPLNVELAWLCGRHKGRERARILECIASGAAAVVVGTHALFQEEVEFATLGLVIIDEQHRFGVHQRQRLRAKRDHGVETAHLLIMTATPIPRSLAMVAYADLDLSVIDTLPPGRQPVTTVALPDIRRAEVIERVRTACASGRQAYWVCTLIDESETLQCQAAEATAAELAAYLPELHIALIHGRIKPAQREALMASFAAGDCELLVATTVIEVGVDVPNASLMIIENPERLGLAQLHQLRGRVGRGAEKSYCVLLYHPPLSATAAERLRILRAEHSGFTIADADLRLRGAGEVLGTRQAGALQLRLADPMRDQDLVAHTRQHAGTLLREHPQAAAALIQRWLGLTDHRSLV